ncbi:alpha/beta hydrolase [Candidatus Saccharibacteria bacterium]|nr:alpha/beta hydrolase [Candidatus Saccharibacteria bacterium]
MNHYALHTETTGTGPVIVMIHGYLASSQYYKKIAKRLSVGHTVIRVDLLGHGRSPKPRAAEYGYDDHINAVRHTLTQLNIKGSFSIVGHSMGALIALRYARLYPQDVSRIVLFNPPMFSSPDEALSDIAATGHHYRAFLFSRFRGAVWRTIKILPRSPRKTRPAVSLSDVLAVPRQAREGSLHNVVMQGNVFEEIEEVDKPTMVVVGQKDRRIYLKNAMRHTWPDHVTLKINEYGHNGMAYHPELAEQYLRTHFL